MKRVSSHHSSREYCMSSLHTEPGTPPRDLNGVSNDPRSLTLTWKAPVQPNGVITEYHAAPVFWWVDKCSTAL